MNAPLELTLGINRAPYVEALYDGIVQPQGIKLTCVNEFIAGGPYQVDKAQVPVTA